MATVRLQLRRGTEAEWDAANPILAAGEMGVETDTRKVKIGDGTTSWTSLDYVAADSPAIGEIAQDAVNDAIVAGVGLDKVYDDNANTITLDIDSTVATLTGTQTLTNKTLTSPSITTPTGIVKEDVGLSNVDNTTDANKPVSTATQTALDLKAPKADPTFTGTVSGVTKTHVGLGNVDNTSDANKPVSTAQATAIATAKSEAIVAAETYTDAFVGAAPGALNSLAELATALGEDANFSTTITNSLALKSPLASPTFTGTVTLPEATSIGNVSNVEIGFLTSVTSDIQGQIDEKLASTTAASTYAPLASPTLTGTVTLPESTSIGNVSNLEIGYLNNVTSSIQGQIDEKLASTTAASTYAPLATPTFTGTVTLPETTSIGNVSNVEIGYLNNVTSSIQGQIDLKAPLASPTFTGTVTLPENTITQSMMSDDSVGTAEIIASSVTSSELAIDAVTEAKIADGAVTSAKIATGTIVNEDINDSAAIATSKISGLDTALGLKAPLASPTFTGTVSGITSAMVGLGSVDNTADTAKPVSTAQATAIATAKSEAIADATAQVNAVIASAPAALNTLDELAAALGDDANFATTVTTSLAAKAPLASPTFTGTVTVAAAGVAFTDATQTKAGVPSITTIGTEISAGYNLSTGGLGLRDQLIPIAGTRAITVPANSTTAYPVGASIDFYQASGTGANFEAAAGVTILGTPGLTLRTTYSSATLTKVATDTWLLAGDLTA